MNPKYLTKIPVEELSNIPDKEDFYELKKNRYWAIDKDGNTIFYKGSPQCNHNKTIAEMSVKNSLLDAVAVIFVKNAFCPHDCSDYEL